MSLLVTYCSCCEARYAKALYSTGSYCEQCLKHLCNPGRYINSYNQGPQLLVSGAQHNALYLSIH